MDSELYLIVNSTVGICGAGNPVYYDNLVHCGEAY
jgi:hypothetical protein